MARIGLISDTHGTLSPDVFDHFMGVDRILHAGDIGDPDILAELRAVAPVDAVFGNTDGFEIRQRVPGTVRTQVDERALVLVHGHELGAPTPAGLAAAYPDADIVVFGHTHRRTYVRIGQQRFVNPGSAGAPRFGLAPSIALLELNGQEITVRFIDLAQATTAGDEPQGRHV